MKKTKDRDYPFGLINDIGKCKKLLEKYLESDFNRDLLIETMEQEAQTILMFYPTRYLTILMDYYKHGKTLESIGEKLGVTRERVRQIKQLALKILSATKEFQ